MRISGQFLCSLIFLVLAGGAYLVTISTSSWCVSGQILVFGLWKYCYLDVNLQDETSWKCHRNNTDFTMVAQAFSILAMMCYVVSFLLYITSSIFSTIHRSRPLVLTLCLLTFCIVSLQIMSMIVFGVKVGRYLKKLEEKHFDYTMESLAVSWSSVFGIISSILATASGICTFTELRKSSMDDSDD